MPIVHRDEELASLLNVLDRKAIEDKQAFAAMMFGIALGLPAIYVVSGNNIYLTPFWYLFCEVLASAVICVWKTL